MNIQLTSTKTLFLKLQPDQEESIEEEKFSFDYQVEFPDSIKNKFIVVIKSLIEHKSGYHLDTIFLAEFQTDIEIDENFKTSKFPFVNAPAIAYPFFRSFIANTLLNSGLEVIYLPAVNFEMLYKKKKEKSEQS
ncbi:protein-export chaperone SecB (plasmid) [Acinetobacter haemolyticus]|uniref:protein-export chaperone SecB n=1 Tax=Acinetobacter TaxID=469 RepID=UPI0021CD93A9|nr:MULTISPECIES: protein-export chaperone SecB [Acinetobacter]UDM39679.1 protein-export chaperone SecB [Acinetobacter haemolyticus]MCU4363318.1 protein-export chaperone SecB [Acinetobacter sp. WU_MDCI_Abxc22]MDC4318701.1 protein-export chaperone SecB [Acinetobacter baumannii]MDC5120199.1 protein-export chaperone SecB [Acinetobacter baumannii]MDH2528315.1 protein-export chaperone SecB [Acinetobacter baumannii]